MLCWGSIGIRYVQCLSNSEDAFSCEGSSVVFEYGFLLFVNAL